MSSSIRCRKGDRGRWIFMRRLLAFLEMTSWAWRCGHAVHVGVIVRWVGWDDEQDSGHQRGRREGFFTSESASGLVQMPPCLRAALSMVISGDLAPMVTL